MDVTVADAADKLRPLSCFKYPSMHVCIQTVYTVAKCRAPKLYNGCESAQMFMVIDHKPRWLG